jgi:hypothetical protein
LSKNFTARSEKENTTLTCIRFERRAESLLTTATTPTYL